MTPMADGNATSVFQGRSPVWQPGFAPLASAAMMVFAALVMAPAAARAQQSLAPPVSGTLPPAGAYPALVRPSMAMPGLFAQAASPAEDEATPPADTPAPPADGADPLASPAPPSPPVPAAPQPRLWLTRGTAVLQALDKVNAQTASLTVPVGQSATYGSLTIAVKGCVVRPADQPQDAAAFLDITDSRPEQPGFSGWVLRSAPSISMLQHPIYDVRVVGCGA
jgi:hypothetical protein